MIQPTLLNIVMATAGSTISCHCGPNCLGVLFFKA